SATSSCASPSSGRRSRSSSSAAVYTAPASASPRRTRARSVLGTVVAAQSFSTTGKASWSAAGLASAPSAAGIYRATGPPLWAMSILESRSESALPDVGCPAVSMRRAIMAACAGKRQARPGLPSPGGWGYAFSTCAPRGRAKGGRDGEGNLERSRTRRERPLRGGRGELLLSSRRREPCPSPGKRHAHGLSVEGRGELLRRGGERPDQQGCRLVLPGPQGGGAQHQGSRRLLARRRGRAMTVPLGRAHFDFRS